jgi:hypothetical protein
MSAVSSIPYPYYFDHENCGRALMELDTLRYDAPALDGSTLASQSACVAWADQIEPACVSSTSLELQPLAKQPPAVSPEAPR